MATFKALNIESDNESDVEVDDTKEIHIEGALKLYQSALKLHAEGPSSFHRASKAYDELFESEIFKYPESQIETRRIEDNSPESDDSLLFSNALDNTPANVSFNLDAGPSTLQQILHLSHKNYAQFKLDVLSAELDSFQISIENVLPDAISALDHFVQALDKDDTDADLWRNTALIGSAIKSLRISRYCLEAVLTDNGVEPGSSMAYPDLEEVLVAEQLHDLVVQIEDHLTLLQSPFSKTKLHHLKLAIKQKLGTYDSLEARINQLQRIRTQSDDHGCILRNRLLLAEPSTWAELGDLLVQQLTCEQTRPSPGSDTLAVAFNRALRAANPDASAKELTKSEDDLTTIPVERSSGISATIDQQFPGLDHGRPTVQPSIAASFTQDSADLSETVPGGINDAQKGASISLPSRKRSGDPSGAGDAGEEGRMRSKRIKARDSNIDPETTRQAMLEANARWEVEQRLDELQALDDWMFKVAGRAFEKIHVTEIEGGRKVREELRRSLDDEDPERANSVTGESSLLSTKFALASFLKDFTEHQVHVLPGDDFLRNATFDNLLTGTRVNQRSDSSAAAGRSFAYVSNDLVPSFLDRVNSGWYTVHEIAWDWLVSLLGFDQLCPMESSYVDRRWPAELKTIVVRVILNFDAYILRMIQDNQLRELDEPRAQFPPNSKSRAYMAQSLFELHLDIFVLIKQPNSGVDAKTIEQQEHRLRRWAEVVREILFESCPDGHDSLSIDLLNIRFLWTTTFYFGALSDVTEEHVIACIDDLAQFILKASTPVLYLPNNAVIPEVSLQALEKEKSKLMTKDFFLKHSDPDLGDPADVIHSLEPLLLHLARQEQDLDDEKDAMPLDVSPQLIGFLQESDVDVRLLLWQRLQDAYRAIDYQPMIINCYFHMLQLTVEELARPFRSADNGSKEHQISIFRNVRIAQNLIDRLHSELLGTGDPFVCLDEQRLRSATITIGRLLQVWHVFNVTEDLIRVGRRKAPTNTNGNILQSWLSMTSSLHDTQIKIWIALYRLFKEAIVQNPDLYETPTEDKFEFLCSVHRNLGVRGICGAANRAFVRMLKDELLSMTTVEHYESEQAQVLYDLYGLNCFVNPATDLTEHNCKHDAFIDKTAAMQAADLLLLQAEKMSMKDLIKHSLKDAIDKVHGSIGRKKPTEAILRNRDILRTFLKSPINRLDLFDCLRGHGNALPVYPVSASHAVLASKRWYFLMGHISLTKFRSQKRTAATPTEDVDIAIAFFMQDLEYSMDNWETWFRLAQAYDTKIEESVVWSAEKLNNSMPELVQLQRAAIHCYATATALACRSASLLFDVPEKMSELYFDFANRLYATSRAPFNMLPFAIDGKDKFLSAPTGIERGPSFPALQTHTVWKLARVLYRRATRNKDHGWMLPYNVTKCLWKLYNTTSESLPQRDRPTVREIIDNLVLTIDAIPKEKRDGREKREPVLEPHYKLVSIVHKLVTRNVLSLSMAREALAHSKYAAKVDFPTSADSWDAYVLSICRNLRTADKSNWHHRIITRCAQIVGGETSPELQTEDPADLELSSARRMKAELMQQLFTKTMVLQVWRPESERAGRHFVYYARYTRNFVQILEVLQDRASLEQLARRIRRRSHDVFEHTMVWQEICHTYLRLLRRYAQVPEGLEMSTFGSIAHEEFLLRKDELEQWMQSQDPGQSATLDVLREVHEMKKINQGLTKIGTFDDLIGDAYAQLFTTLEYQTAIPESQEVLEADSVKPEAAVSPARNPTMSLNNLLSVEPPEVKSNSEPTAVSLNDNTQINATSSVMEPPTRNRNRVGRREIRLCAEACFQKAATAQIKESTRLQAAGTRVQVVIETNRIPASAEAGNDNSAPASIHDSADDESELSELEEIGSDGENAVEVNDTEMNDGSINVEPSIVVDDEVPAARTSIKGFETVNEIADSDSESMIDKGEANN